MNKIWVENQFPLLKRSKASGPDNLPPGMLKDCSNELSGPLCCLINLAMINSTIPNEWSLAKVILFSKKETELTQTTTVQYIYYLYRRRY